jgi:hypothetical protein
MPKPISDRNRQSLETADRIAEERVEPSCLGRLPRSYVNGAYLDAAGGRRGHLRERTNAPPLDMSGKRLVVMDRRRPTQGPLKPNAYHLLGEYHRLAQFWRAIVETKAPPPVAGEWCLGLKPKASSQAYAKRNALLQFDPHPVDPGAAPLRWFRQAVLDAMALSPKSARHVRPGRETERSPVADSFFLTLARGVGYVEKICLRHGADTELERFEIDDESPIHAEVNDYLFHSGAFYDLVTDDLPAPLPVPTWVDVDFAAYILDIEPDEVRELAARGLIGTRTIGRGRSLYGPDVWALTLETVQPRTRHDPEPRP